MSKFSGSEIKKFIKFAIVGISGTIVDMGILFLLTSIGWQTLPANIVSYSGGIVNNYIWNSRWTFKQASQEKRISQFIQFTIVSLVGMGLNSLIVVTLEPIFQPILTQKGALFGAKIIATGVFLIWNFIANNLWTFKTSN